MSGRSGHRFGGRRLLVAGGVLVAGPGAAVALLDVVAPAVGASGPRAPHWAEPDPTLSEAAAAQTIDAAAAAAASTPAASAFDDGRVTLEEYRAGIGDEQQCVRSQLDALASSLGLDVRITTSSLDTSADDFEVRYTFSIDGLVPADVAERHGGDVARISTRCHDQHTRHLQAAYQAAYRADPGRMRTAAAAAIRCLEAESGTRLDPGATARRPGSVTEVFVDAGSADTALGRAAGICAAESPAVLAAPGP